MRALFAAILLAGCFWPAVVHAAPPTLKDISRSFDHNVSQKPDMGKVFLILLGAAGIIAILVVAAHWGQRQERPKTLNHPGRLLREMKRKIHLSNPQIKRLKVLADRRGCDSPLTMLLCPSLLAPSRTTASIKKAAPAENKPA